MGRLTGKRVLMSAAGQGIGRASALAMAREGAEVVATDVNAEALATLQASGITTRILDVRSPAAIADCVASAGRVDVLFNCAGYVANGTILDCNEDEWALSFDLNLTSMFRMIRAVLPGMIAEGAGSIINMASVAGAIIAAPNRSVYSATKAGVIGLTKSVAADFVTKGIRCNAICPGTVDSPSLHDRMRASGNYEAAHAAFLARQPMGRMATTEEIAMLVVYLASNESSFTTGAAHVIDGGWSNT